MTVVDDQRSAGGAEHAAGELRAFEALAASDLDAVLRVNVEGHILFFNPVAEALFGRSAAEVAGQPMSEVIVPPSLRGAHDAGMKRYLDTGERRVIGRRVELNALHSTGEELPVELIVNEVTLGGERSFIAHIRDLREQKAREQAIEAARDEAIRASAARQELLAILGHELRGPLQSVVGLTELAVEEEVPPLTRALLDTALASAHGIVDILDDLGRADVGDRGLGPEERRLVDVGRSIAHTVRAFSAAARELGLGLSLVIDPSLPKLAEVPLRTLRQVLTNLTSNAVKYTPSGHISVSARWSEADGQLVFRVRDTGPGVPDDARERVFERGTRLSTETQGSGLGLHISRELMERAGGRLDLVSVVGAGACFEGRLPITPSSAATEQPLDGATVNLAGDVTVETLGKHLVREGASLLADEQAQVSVRVLDVPAPADADHEIQIVRHTASARAGGRPPAKVLLAPVAPSEVIDAVVQVLSAKAEPAVPRRGRRALVVDDVPENRRLLKRRMEKMGFAVTLASDGEEAVGCVEREAAFDIALFDVEMPRMTGIDAARVIRALPGARGELPIIAVTARDVPATRVAAEEAGMDRFLVKPVSVPVMRAAVVDALGLRTALVVEDDPVQRLLLKRRLESRGLLVAEASGVDDALALNLDVDLLTVDIEMQGSGADAIRQLRTKHAPSLVAVISGHPPDIARARVEGVAVDELFQKPMSSDDFDALVAKLPARAPSPSAAASRAEPAAARAEPPALALTLPSDPAVIDLLPELLRNRRAELQALQLALRGNDLETAGKIGHRFKGTMGSFGFPVMSDMGADLEEAARAGNQKRANAAAADLERGLNALAALAERAGG